MNNHEFDQFAGHYDKVLCESIPFGLGDDQYLAEYKIVHVKKLVAGRAINHILDFGCGAGRSLPYFSKHFPQASLSGFDLSSESLEMARVRNPKATLYADWALVTDRRFDLIFAANVFHHIPDGDQLAALERCKNVLAQHGRMIVFEHNPINPVTRWLFERCPFDAHATMIPKWQLMRRAQSAGLRVVDDGYTLFFPQQLRVLRRLEPSLRWLPIGAQYFVVLEAKI